MKRIGLAVLGLSLGCAPSRVHPPKLARVPDEPAARIESAWTRHALPAEGLTVHATLWDATLVSAAAAGDRRSNASTAWTQRYLERTAFTVVVEIEDRQPVIDPAPLLDPAGWSFGLSLNKGDDAPRTDVLAPIDVDLLLVDRFPSPSGDHHHRITMAVFFEGALYDAAKHGESVSLVVKPRLAAPERGRSMLGAWWSERGATLRWRVRTDATP